MGRIKQLDGCSTVSAFSWAVTSGTLAVAAIVGTICLAIAAFGQRGAVVGDVTLPASLIQRGFTTTIVARRLLDEVGRLREISLTDRVEAFLVDDTPASTPAMKVAEGREVWERLLRAVSGSHTQAFTGEIVESHGSGDVPLYEGRLRYGDVLISDRRGASASSSVDTLLRDMAFGIYRRLDPMRAAYVAWTFGDLDGMRLAMRPLLLASDTGPTVATAFFLLADLELKHGDLAAAEDHVLRGLGKSPRQAFGLQTWGRILQAKGLLAEALAVAAEACRHDMISASGCTLLGEVHLEQAVLARGNARHYRQAYQAFLRALSLDESSEAALAGAAQAAAASGDHPAALRLIDVALARAPLDTALLLRKTWILFKGGDLGYANRLLSELLEKNPDLLVRHPDSNSDAHLKLELARFADMRMPK